jgi:hypothetical protein
LYRTFKIKAGKDVSVCPFGVLQAGNVLEPAEISGSSTGRIFGVSFPMRRSDGKDGRKPREKIRIILTISYHISDCLSENVNVHRMVVIVAGDNASLQLQSGHTGSPPPKLPTDTDELV